MSLGDALLWLYAGFVAGVLSRTVDEPAYAMVLIFPLLFAAGVSPQTAAVGLTMAIGIALVLNLLYQKIVTGASVQVKPSKSIPVILGVVLGTLVWALLPWHALKLLVAASLGAAGTQLLVGRTLKIRRGRLVLNLLVGVAEALLGAVAAFALARVFIGEIEALLPVLRGVGTLTATALKLKPILGGALAGVGIFLGQRVMPSTQSPHMPRVAAVVMFATAIYILLA